MNWFSGVLTLIFVVAKLTGVITWSWWLVFLPVLVAFVISITVLLIIAIAYIIK